MLRSTLQTAAQFFRTYAHVMVALLVLVGVLWYFGVRDTTAMWYTSDGVWDQRQKITIQSSAVDSDLADFPVYVDLSDMTSEFHDGVTSNAGDIRVTTADGRREVPREVVFYDAATDTGELHFKAPNISASEDTSFYIYWGNSSASDYSRDHRYGSENVWGDNYNGVWHFSDQEIELVDLPSQRIGIENPAGGYFDGNFGNHYKISSDITFKTATIDAQATTSETFVLYKFDPDTQGPDEGILVDSVNFSELGTGANNVTLNLETDGPGDYWLGRTGTSSLMRDDRADTGESYPFLSDPAGVQVLGGMSFTSSGSLNDNWYWLFDLEIEGSADESRITVTDIPEQQIGLAPTGSYYSGDYGLEFQVQGDATLKTATIDAEAAGTTTFELYKYDSELENPDQGTLVDSVVLSGLSAGENNVTLDLTTDGPGRYWVGRPDGFSLRRSETGQAFPFVSSPEGIEFLTGRNFGGSGTASRWYYLFNLQVEGEALSVNTEDRTGVDSTSNQNDGALTGVLSPVDGVFGQAQRFANGEGYHYKLNQGAVPVNDDFTISAWLSIPADATADDVYYMQGDGSTGDRFVIYSVTNFGDGNNSVRAWSDATGQLVVGNDNRGNGWLKTTIVRDGSNWRLYEDNTLVSTTTASESLVNDADGFIGLDNVESDRHFYGDMAGMRVHSSAVSADWISTEHLNQSSPTTFYALGVQEVFDPPTLSGPTGSATGEYTADGSVTTDQAVGELYAVLTTSASKPTRAEVKDGEDHTGEAAAYSASQTVDTTGTKNFSATNLDPDTTYWWHFMHEDGAGEWSSVSTSESFTTASTDDSNPWSDSSASVFTTTVTESQVSQSSDDAEEFLSDNSMYITSSDLELVDENGTNDQEVGMRFQNIDIPQGAVVTNAYIEFQTDETDSSTTNLTFHSQATDDAATFSSNTGDITGRTKNTETVDWNDVPAWDTVGEKHQTPDLTNIIQPVMDRAGWSSGNALAVIVTGDGERTAESYNGDSANAPLLHVEYENSGTSTREWKHRQKITIDHEKVDDDLTDFPVYVDLSHLPAEFHNNVAADGGDIRVTTADGQTEVPREVVSYDDGTDSGEMHFKAPFLSGSSDTSFYIYYGNDGAEDYATSATYGAENVWSDYAFSTRDTVNDSTTNGITGTVSGATTGATGKLGEASSFDGTDDYINFGTQSQLTNSDTVTLSAWVQIDDYSDFRSIAGRGYLEPDTGYGLYANSTGLAFQAREEGTTATAGASFSDTSNWHLLTGVRTPTTTYLYIDGSLIDTQEGNVSIIDSNDFQVGASDSGGPRFFFDGLIDEVRVANSEFSADRILTEYNNQNDPVSFYSLDTEENNPSIFGQEANSGWGDDRWAYREKITIQSSEVDSDLTDFPVYVDLADLGNDFFNNVRNDGGDIRVTAGDGTTELPREVVSINTSSNSGELHFKADSISASSDTDFYIYYSNAEAVDYLDDEMYGTENVWTNGFEAVYHMSDDPSDAAPQILDSTNNDQDLTSNGSMTSGDSVSGTMGNAINFDGVDDYLQLNSTSSADGSSGFTISAFFSADATGQDLALVGTRPGLVTDENIGMRYDQSGASGGGTDVVKFAVENQAGAFVQGETESNLQTTNNQHLALQWSSGSSPKIFADGIEVTYTDTPGTLSGTAIFPDFYIGRGLKDVDGFWDGLIDEVRILSVARSAGWITAEYSNQNDTSSFYSVDSQEDNPYVFGIESTEDWGDTRWSHREKLTIKSSEVDADLNDFPVYVDLANLSENFHENVRSDAGDIRVTTADGQTEIPREVVDYSAGNNDGELHFKAPHLSNSVDTDFYIYYGNDLAEDYSADATYGAENVWSDEYLGVWHLNEDSGDAIDSTSGGYDGTVTGPTQGVDGTFSTGYDFDGTDDYVKVTDNFVSSPTSLTISSWFKKESGGDNYEAVLHKGSQDTVGSSDYWLGVSAGDNLTATIGANTSVGWEAGETTTSVNIGQWYHLLATWDGSTVRVYIDGEFDKEYSLSSYGDLNTDTRFGASADGTNYQFSGTTEDIRIYSKSLSDAEVSTMYTNQDTPLVFYSVGTDEDGPIPTVSLDEPYSESTGVSRTPTLTWDSIGSAFDYDLQVSTSSDFSSLTVDETATTSSMTLGPPQVVLADDETYYWRVRGKNNDSTGDWSSVYNFSTESGIVGTGTSTDPYLIATPQDLDDVRNDLGGYYELTQDIDLTYDTQDPSGDFYNGGEGWDSIENFDGDFNMAGHSIIGAYINYGFFGDITANAVIHSGMFVDAEVPGKGSGDHGVVAQRGNGLIREVVVTESSIGSGAGDANMRTGAFSGRGVSSQDIISRNNAIGDTAHHGGNTGRVFDVKEYTRNLIHNVTWDNPSSGSSNPVYGSIQSGGNATVTNTFYDSDTLNHDGDDTNQGTGLTTTEAQNIDTYTAAGWDIVRKGDHDGQQSTATWYIDDGNDYPRLWFEYEVDNSMEGSGTAADPYIVETTQDFNDIRNARTANYQLANDIDMDGFSWTPIWGFDGEIDGAGYVVSNLSHTTSGGSTGLVFDNPQINFYLHDISFTNAYLEATSDGRFGIIAGYPQNGITIDRVRVQGTVTSSGNDRDFGGFIGRTQSNGIEVNDSYADVDVINTGATDRFLGGMVGNLEQVGDFRRTYAIGSVSGSDPDRMGAWLGQYRASTRRVEDSFFSPAETGIDTATAASSTEDLEANTNIAVLSTDIDDYTAKGWDIVHINDHDGRKDTATWYIDDGNDYPRLWFEYNTRVDNGMEGSGTAANPYQVATPQNLHDVRLDPDAYYRQVADIDLTFDTQDSSGDFYNGGEGWEPLGDSTTPFTGEYNFNGHSIVGLTIDRPSSNYQGLFGRISDSAHIHGGQILDADVVARRWSAVTVGRINSGSNAVVEEMSVKGSMEGTDDTSLLVGWQRGGNVRNSRGEGTVNGVEWVGGMLGADSDNPNSNLYFVGTTFASSGSNWGGVSGGLGSSETRFYDVDVAGEVYPEDPESATSTAQMKNIQTYLDAGWDIVPIEDHDGQESTATWYIDDGNDYPRLWFEYEEMFGMQSSAGWGDDRWDYREKITIDADAIDEDLTDFPVYVDLADLSGDFHENVRSDGGDIRVTAGDRTTQLAREVVSYDDTTDTGELHFKAPSLSSTEDTSFYIYYGNPEATDLSESAAYGAQNVWTNGYELVSHDGGATDSTINGNDSTAGGGVTVGGATGQLGDATAFDGTDDHFSLPNRHTAGESEVTLSLWLNPVSCGSSQAIYDEAWDDDPNNPKYWQFSAYCGTWYTRDTSTGRTGGRNNDLSMPAISDGAWQHLTFAYSTAGGYKRVYLDGNQEAETTNSVDQLTSDEAGYNYIARPNDGSYFEGSIDELRLATVQRSDGWLAAEHANQAGDGNFYTTGATNVTAESWNMDDWPHREKITIQASEVDGNLTDFPVYVDMADLSTDFHSLVRDDGGDIRVTNASGTELAREIVSIDTSSETGELHFKADSVSSSTDTTFYIYYGNAGAINYPMGGTYGRNAVWSDFIAVWHMGTVTDSSGNGYTLQPQNGLSIGNATSDKLGGATRFEQSNDHYADTEYFPGGTSEGISYWARFDSDAPISQQYTGIFHPDRRLYLGTRFISSNEIVGGYGDTAVLSTDSDITYDNWILLTMDAGDLFSVHVNGDDVVDPGTDSGTYTGTSGLSFTVGARNHIDNGLQAFVGGILDEFRIHKEALSNQYRVTEYNNQNSPSTFYTTSSQSQESTTAPTPDPMTFEASPENASANSITMTATEASGSGPFAYKFFAESCATNGGTGSTDSGWQTDRTYTDTGLDANQCYEYSVKVRDSQGNETATSTAASTYTSAAVPGLPTLSSASDTTLDLSNSAGSNLLSTPTTTFAVRITETAPNDGTWDGQYVAADGTQSGTPVWLTDSELDAITIQNLQPGTSYTAQAMARNEDGDETALSTPATTSTTGGTGGGSAGTSTQLRGGSTIRGGTNLR